jgi:hypothetical protein
MERQQQVKVNVKVEQSYIYSGNPIERALHERGFTGPSFDWPLEVAMNDFSFADHPNAIEFPLCVRVFQRKYYAKSTWNRGLAYAWSVLQPFSFEVEVDDEWYQSARLKWQGSRSMESL